MGCSHSCSGCHENCASRTQAPADFKEPMNEDSNIKHVIAVLSGKGGVGKSLVTSTLACRARAKGLDVAVLDADITGPSIPKSFGLSGGVGATADGKSMLPAITSTGIKVLSTNLLLADEREAIIWRGPVIGSAIKQFWSQTIWGDVDYMFVDMPPGTGDVALTIFQSLPIEGIVMVTTPQDLVSMIVSKAVNMASKMSIPIIGLVENMSYFTCPDCGGKHHIFGESHIEEISKEYGIPILARIPIDPNVASAVDAGSVEYLEATWMDEAVAKICS